MVIGGELYSDHKSLLLEERQSLTKNIFWCLVTLQEIKHTEFKNYSCFENLNST